MFDNWVLDATFYRGENEPLSFCPILDNGNLLTGFAFISDRCPQNFVGVIHADGQEAAEKFCEEHKDLIERLKQPQTKDLNK